jgi:multiple sugar transport system substrate-binding protein
MFSCANITSYIPSTAGLEWDMVTMPVFLESPKSGIQQLGPVVYVTSTSNHKDEAFAVLAHYLSAEIQTERTRGGEPSVLADTSINQQFGQDRTYLKGKNLKSFFGNNIAPTPKLITKYDSLGVRAINSAFISVISGKTDVNTALRQADDTINKGIQQELNK